MSIPAKDATIPFDFDWEATTAAVNEACEGKEENCSWSSMCPYCLALQKAIKIRLIRAFMAGKRAGSNG